MKEWKDLSRGGKVWRTIWMAYVFMAVFGIVGSVLFPKSEEGSSTATVEAPKALTDWAVASVCNQWFEQHKTAADSELHYVADRRGFWETKEYYKIVIGATIVNNYGVKMKKTISFYVDKDFDGDMFATQYVNNVEMF